MSGRKSSTSTRSHARPASGTVRRMSSQLTKAQAPKRRRADPSAPGYIVAGAVIAILGLGFAIGLAVSPGAAERALALKLLPWLVAAGGVGLSVFGFKRL
jgi:hypothetical protein